MSKFIIDTNVWVVASGKAPQSTPECVEACLEILRSLQQAGASLVVDEASFMSNPPGNSVLEEFKNNLDEGDYGYDLFWRKLFPRWGVDWEVDLVELLYDVSGAILPNGITITQQHPDGGSGPFEPNDRKWIALQLIHPNHPVINNATDSDWEKARQDLTTNNIKIKQLCTGRDIP